jgi:MarR family transcriptional regulator, 2-MHQ and catechol-resistance regulon repressor
MAERYLRSIRLLAECMQGFERFSAEHIRRYDLTPSQFDIIATLGNTEGMTCKTLGEKTLITKGTMTGVLDRLEKKGLIERGKSLDDRRCQFVRLSAQGTQMFQEVFPQVVQHGKILFDQYAEADFAAIERELGKLKKTIESCIP